MIYHLPYKDILNPDLHTNLVCVLKAAFKIQIFHALAKLVKAKILSPLWRRACHQSDNKRLWRSLKNILISFRIYEQFHNSMSFEFLYSCIKYGIFWIISLRSFHQTWTSYFYKDNVNYISTDKVRSQITGPVLSGLLICMLFHGKLELFFHILKKSFTFCQNTLN